ncbi:outer membrane beta-barrel protein, partial [Xanthovirga aplysinae]|uniref:outer membrane beta-barrel protein n=1 Tax=Xanthovirga aplysinae TaxID=2529853 RepID=UPI001656EFF9
NFQKQVEKTKLEFGGLVGVSLTSLQFKSDLSSFTVANTDYPISTDFSAGLFLDVVLPRNQRRLSIYNELLFSSYNVEGRYTNFVDQNYYDENYTKIGYSYLKMNNMIRFKYPLKNSFIYLNAGMSNGFAIKETNYKKVESRFYSTEEVREGKALEETNKYEQGYVFGIGSKIKRCSFELRYEVGSGMSIYEALGSFVHRSSFLLGYRF